MTDGWPFCELDEFELPSFCRGLLSEAALFAAAAAALAAAALLTFPAVCGFEWTMWNSSLLPGVTSLEFESNEAFTSLPEALAPAVPVAPVTVLPDPFVAPARPSDGTTAFGTTAADAVAAIANNHANSKLQTIKSALFRLVGEQQARHLQTSARVFPGLDSLARHHR